jgi:hypothetical protein
LQAEAPAQPRKLPGLESSRPAERPLVASPAVVLPDTAILTPVSATPVLSGSAIRLQGNR